MRFRRRTASGPKGDAQGWENGRFFLSIPLPFRQPAKRRLHRHRLLSNDGRVGNEWKNFRHVLTAQPTLAAGKGWGDFDIQLTVSVQVPVSGRDSPGDTAEMNRSAFGDPILWNTAFQYHFMQFFWPELEVNYRVLAEWGARRPQPSLAYAGHHIGALQDRPGHRDPPSQPDFRRRISGGSDVKSGHQKQFRRDPADHLLNPGLGPIGANIAFVRWKSCAISAKDDSRTPAGPESGSHRDRRSTAPQSATMSSISQSLSVTRAAIAGVMRRAFKASGHLIPWRVLW